MYIFEPLNSNQFIRHLTSHGVSFKPGRGKGGHIRVERNGVIQHVPKHGSRKELGIGIMHSICKALGVPKP